MMNRRKAITLACAAAAGLSRPTLGIATRKPSADGVVRLGQSTALTGVNGAVGRQFRDAALGWFNVVNSQGGAGGYRIELMTLDDGGVVERATTNSKLLTSTHGAAGFFGFAGPGANREGMQGAMEEGVPFIAPVSGMDVLRQRDNTNVYLLRAGHRDEIRQIIRHTRSTGTTRVALLFDYESAGWEIRDSFAQSAENAKLASSVSASVSRGSVDVDPAVAALVAANPQAIILAANPSASAAFVRAARKAGFGGSFYTVSTVGGQVLLDQLGQLAVGISVAQVVPFPWGGTTAISREFLGFCAASQLKPDFASMEGYIAARWLTEALKRAKPREPSAAALGTALEQMPALSLSGFPLAFSSDTRSASSFVELTVVSSQLKFLK
ncbi:ABC transporter substrate-binding protein [Polaromonas sp. JS666]|uniref:ABC transporter substrate-binding protein n=1 Tax=Polaromonas sp. (strain JS666 / ATCC BAA-500) TaxID=296591 RepID=UPI0000464E77|nr:ABC transporter substrate-binding protein [Polaromonas sp. JS666]ABE42665.1 amino acid/amide ABC transporter substrate-binding protein, HAAT family [Polaromonas sp. JS666]